MHETETMRKEIIIMSNEKKEKLYRCKTARALTQRIASDFVLKSFCTGLFSIGVSVLILAATIKYTRTLHKLFKLV